MGRRCGSSDVRLHLAIGLFHHRVGALHYEPLLKEVHYLYCGREHHLFACSDLEINPEDLLEYDNANRRQAETEGELASDFGTRGVR